MKRKIIKQANQAYTITLPITWVRLNNLSENSELDVELDEKNLIIKSSHEICIKKASIQIKRRVIQEVSRKINALYAKGIDEIEIISEEDISKEIVQSLSQTIGYVLISQSDKKYIVRDIGNTNYSEIDDIFKRVFQMILSFYESAINDIFSLRKETMDKLDSRDSEINKFCLYLQRAINKMSYSNTIKGRILFTYSFELERIGDEIFRFWRTSIQNKIKIDPKIREMVYSSKEGLDLSFDSYFIFNEDISNKLYLAREKVRKELFSLSLDRVNVKIANHSLKIIESALDLNHLAFMINLEKNN